MHILFFMTRGMSLAEWDKNGSLSREIGIYEYFASRGNIVSVISWGGGAEKKYKSKYPWLNIYCNNWNFKQSIYERYIPILHAKPLIACDVIKSNQTSGSEFALKSSNIWGKPFFSRCGYMWSSFVALQNPDFLENAQNIEQKVFYKANKCIVTTNEIRLDIMAKYSIPSNKIEVIPNYVPDHFFNYSPPDHSKTKEYYKVLHIGRLTSAKNILSLVEACKGLPIELTLIGTGEDYYKIKESIKENGIKAKMLGSVKHSELPKYISKADICTIVSHYEGHPKVLLEYMACGSTILASNVKGTSQLIENGQNALKCDTDPSSIRCNLKKLIDNSSLRTKLGIGAKKYAKKFSLELIASQELELYKSLSKSSRLSSFIFGFSYICKSIFKVFQKKTNNIFFSNKIDIENMSDVNFMNLIQVELQRRGAKTSKKRFIQMLFDLENDLYVLQSQYAISYNNGIHPKHRLTKYHDFFCDRISEDEKILDVGCGNGSLAFSICSKTRAIVTGIDFDKQKIKEAKSKYKKYNIKFICANVLHIIPNSTFDTAILSNILEHLPERSNFLLKLQSKYKIKRFLIRVPLFERDWRVPFKKEIGVEWRLDKTHEIEYTKESFLFEIEQSGLTIEYCEIRWGEIWCEAQVPSI